MTKNEVIKPGSVIGILGGGQLGKMTAMAAARLGYKTLVWTPPGDNPATHVATRFITKPFDDEDAFFDFVRLADVCTIEFENVPVGLLRKISMHIPVRPSPDVLEVTQDRWNEKKLFASMSVSSAPSWLVEATGLKVETLLADARFPAILKTARLGYDGHGQLGVASLQDVRNAFHALGTVPCVLEEKIDFACEGSVIVARNPEGVVMAYPVFQNYHVNGILDLTTYPANKIDEDVQDKAIQIALAIAKELKLEGILAVEMFFTADGQILVNELAPRPHNSGHGTIEACYTSQFEQHVRAICNLPLGYTTPHSGFEMKNLIGDAVKLWQGFLSHQGTTLHLYGKEEARPGRKMGHVTTLYRV